MELLCETLYFIGAIGLYAGWMWTIWLAFRRSTVFGVACLLVPMLILYFLVTSPRHTWRPALVLLSSLSIIVGATQLAKL